MSVVPARTTANVVPPARSLVNPPETSASGAGDALDAHIPMLNAVLAWINGYSAVLHGGAVRDMIRARWPRDFDVIVQDPFDLDASRLRLRELIPRGYDVATRIDAGSFPIMNAQTRRCMLVVSRDAIVSAVIDLCVVSGDPMATLQLWPPDYDVNMLVLAAWNGRPADTRVHVRGLHTGAITRVLAHIRDDVAVRVHRGDNRIPGDTPCTGTVVGANSCVRVGICTVYKRMLSLMRAGLRDMTEYECSTCGCPCATSSRVQSALRDSLIWACRATTAFVMSRMRALESAAYTRGWQCGRALVSGLPISCDALVCGFTICNVDEHPAVQYADTILAQSAENANHARDCVRKSRARDSGDPSREHPTTRELIRDRAREHMRVCDRAAIVTELLALAESQIYVDAETARACNALIATTIATGATRGFADGLDVRAAVDTTVHTTIHTAKNTVLAVASPRDP